MSSQWGLATPAQQSRQKTFDLYKFLIITIINPKLLFKIYVKVVQQEKRSHQPEENTDKILKLNMKKVP